MPILDDVTPLVLTRDEAPNIGRTLGALRWAKRVIVLDSGSRDETEAIARSFANVSWHVRPFDDFARQTEFGLRGTGIDTTYVLALDADMAPEPNLAAELEERFLGRGFAGGRLGVVYAYSGTRLIGSFYPSQVRLFRRDAVRVRQVGHGHTFEVLGRVLRLRARLVHDDRKPLERWLLSQAGYARVEAASPRRWALLRRLRRAGVVVPLAGLAAYLRAGGPLAGLAARRYALERATFEAILALRLVDDGLAREADALEPGGSP